MFFCMFYINLMVNKMYVALVFTEPIERQMFYITRVEWITQLKDFVFQKQKNGLY